MRAILAGTLAAAAFALGPAAPAGATWSSPRTFAAAGSQGARLAVNARGDAAVLWTSQAPARLRVTLLPAEGPRSTRTLAPAPDGAQQVVLDRAGGVTVAWIDSGRLFGAHGSLGGRWSSAQRLVGRDADDPRLAVAPDRRVVLVWTTVSATGPGGTGAAWRSPGQPFTRPTRMTRPAPGLLPGEAPQSDNGAAFDADGRAYLWSSCDGVVRTAAPGSRRLALVTVAPQRVLGFSLSVTGSGQGLAGWVDSACATDPAAGSAPGRLLVRPLRGGTFGPATALTAGLADPASFLAFGTVPIALPGGGGLVTAWPTTSARRPVVVAVGADGTEGATVPTTDGQVPQEADAAGNLLLSMPYAGFVVRRRTGAAEPFDKGGPEHTGMGASPAVVPQGRGFAVVWDPDLRTQADGRATSPARRLSVSRWTP